MAREINVEDLQPGDVYRTLGGRGERRLRRATVIKPFSSGTTTYIQVENVDPRTDTRATGAVSLVKGMKVEVVSLIDDDDWETDVLNRLDVLDDGHTVTFWAVGSDLYA